MMIVGLTGGIGSGKSEAARLFAALGIPIIDTDMIAHKLTAPGQPALASIAAAFGEEAIASDGSLDRVLEMPTSRPSCCAFGGDDFRTLFVTSANVGMSQEELAKDPQAGSLFSVQLDDVRGLASAQFAI